MFQTEKSIEILDSHTVAAYISRKIGRKMSHLKLQKLLFYVDAYHLAYFGKQLVEDEFEAWAHGPVSRVLYNKLRDKSVLYKEIQYVVEEGEIDPLETVPSIINESQLEIVDTVLDTFGDMTGTQLEALTHSEEPWISAREGFQEGDRCTEKISKELTKVYYKKFLFSE